MNVPKTASRADRVRRALKAAQGAQGYTQEDIAKRMKVTQATVSRWYNNPDEIPLGVFRVLCKVLALSPMDILSIE